MIYFSITYLDGQPYIDIEGVNVDTSVGICGQYDFAKHLLYFSDCLDDPHDYLCIDELPECKNYEIFSIISYHCFSYDSLQFQNASMKHMKK